MLHCTSIFLLFDTKWQIVQKKKSNKPVLTFIKKSKVRQARGVYTCTIRIGKTR